MELFLFSWYQQLVQKYNEHFDDQIRGGGSCTKPGLSFPMDTSYPKHVQYQRTRCIYPPNRETYNESPVTYPAFKQLPARWIIDDY